MCHWAWSSKLLCKISVLEKMTLKVLFFVIFRRFPNYWNYHFRSKSWTARCDVQLLYILQSNCSCTVRKCRTRGEHSPYSQIIMKFLWQIVFLDYRLTHTYFLHRLEFPMVSTLVASYDIINNTLWHDSTASWQKMWNVSMSYGTIMFLSISLFSLHVLHLDFSYIDMYKKRDHIIQKVYSF